MSREQAKPNNPEIIHAPEEENEKDIIKRAKDGDEKAWNILYKKYYNQLFSFTMSKIKSRHDAEDVMQTTWVKAWEKLPTLKKDNFKSWIFAITYRTIIDEIRKRKTNKIAPNQEDQLSSQLDPKSLDDSGVFPIEKKTEESKIREAINLAASQLEDKDLDVVTGRAQDENFENIAEGMGIKRQAAVSRFNRAKAKIKETLEKMGIKSNFLEK